MAMTTEESSLIQIRLHPSTLWHEAKHFETLIQERVIRFQNDRRQTLSEHFFPRNGYTQHFPFLSRAGDTTRYLKYNVTSLLSLTVRSVDEQVKNQRPIYSFQSRTAYKLFLEHLRALEADAADLSSQFQRDFACNEVAPDEQNKPYKYKACHNVCVKVWHHANRPPTISVPFLERRDDGSSVTIMKELETTRFELYKPLFEKKQVDILLSQAEINRTVTAWRVATCKLANTASWLSD